jgi:hypothetical protein
MTTQEWTDPMASSEKRSALWPIPWLIGSGLVALSLHYLLSDRAGIIIAKRFSKNLMEGLKGKVTDDFLDLLLIAMDLTFYLSRSYRKNIKNFKGSYLFETRKDGVRSGVTFENGNMKVYLEGMPDSDWNAKVTFEDSKSLWKYLLSKDQSILDSLLENTITIEGNANLIFRFCFLVNDLKRRFGLET